LLVACSAVLNRVPRTLTCAEVIAPALTNNFETDAGVVSRPELATIRRRIVFAAVGLDSKFEDT